MFNKYQRDLQAKRVAELQKQRVVSGYLRDDKFETSPALQRVLASPSRTINSSPIGGTTNQTGTALPEQKSINPNASQTSLNASTSPMPGSHSMIGNGLTAANGLMLSDEAKRMIKIRSKRTNDLANRSRQRMQGWLSNVGPPMDLISSKWRDRQLLIRNPTIPSSLSIYVCPDLLSSIFNQKLRTLKSL